MRLQRAEELREADIGREAVVEIVDRRGACGGFPDAEVQRNVAIVGADRLQRVLGVDDVRLVGGGDSLTECVVEDESAASQHDRGVVIRAGGGVRCSLRRRHSPSPYFRDDIVLSGGQHLVALTICSVSICTSPQARDCASLLSHANCPELRKPKHNYRPTLAPPLK